MVRIEEQNGMLQADISGEEYIGYTGENDVTFRQFSLPAAYADWEIMLDMQQDVCRPDKQIDDGRVLLTWRIGRQSLTQPLLEVVLRAQKDGMVKKSNVMRFLVRNTVTYDAASADPLPTAFYEMEARIREIRDSMEQDVSQAAQEARQAGELAAASAARADRAAQVVEQVFPYVAQGVTPCDLFADYRVSGSRVAAMAVKAPLAGCRLYGTQQGVRQAVIRVRGYNQFWIHAPYTYNQATAQVEQTPRGIKLKTKASTATFREITYTGSIFLQPGETYTLSSRVTVRNNRDQSQRGEIRIGKADGTFIKFLSGTAVNGTFYQACTFTVPEDGRVQLSLRYHNTAAIPLAEGIEVEWEDVMLSREERAYAPYRGADYPVSLPQPLYAGESVQVENVYAVDGYNHITNDAGSQMDITFYAALPYISGLLEQNQA